MTLHKLLDHPDPRSDLPEHHRSINMTKRNAPVSPGKKVKRDSDGESDREHDVPPHDPDQEGVLGEVERPAPPSEKPEACLQPFSEVRC